MTREPVRLHDPETGFYSEDHSQYGMEAWLKRHLLDHLVKLIPSFVHPNIISIANHFVAWMAFLAAAAAPFMGSFNQLTARLLAAGAIFVCICLDCLDGMHARRTGQSSRLGEVMDHWLDAMNVGLYTAAVVLTLNVDPFTAAVGAVTAIMNYNAQLVLYHHSGRFLHPGTSGIDAQVAIVGLFVGLGVIFYFVPQSHPWVRLGTIGIAWASILFINLTDLRFYWVRMRGYLLPHIKFVLLCAMFTVPLWLGMIDQPVYLIVIGFISFRVSGSYVLHTVRRLPYAGADWSIALWALVLVVGNILLAPYSLRGYPVQKALPYAFMLYILAVNLIDILRSVAPLREEDLREAARENDYTHMA